MTADLYTYITIMELHEYIGVILHYNNANALLMKLHYDRRILSS